MEERTNQMATEPLTIVITKPELDLIIQILRQRVLKLEMEYDMTVLDDKRTEISERLVGIKSLLRTLRKESEK